LALSGWSCQNTLNQTRLSLRARTEKSIIVTVTTITVRDTVKVSRTIRKTEPYSGILTIRIHGWNRSETAKHRTETSNPFVAFFDISRGPSRVQPILFVRRKSKAKTKNNRFRIRRRIRRKCHPNSVSVPQIKKKKITPRSGPSNTDIRYTMSRAFHKLRTTIDPRS